MSRLTEIMFLASAQWTRFRRSLNRHFEPPPRLGHLVGRHVRGQLHWLGEVGAEQAARLADAARRPVARDNPPAAGGRGERNL